MTKEEFFSWYQALPKTVRHDGSSLFLYIVTTSNINRIDVHYPKRLVSVVRRLVKREAVYDLDMNVRYCAFASFTEAYDFTQKLSAISLLPITQW